MEIGECPMVKQRRPVLGYTRMGNMPRTARQGAGKKPESEVMNTATETHAQQ